MKPATSKIRVRTILLERFRAIRPTMHALTKTALVDVMLESSISYARLKDSQLGIHDDWMVCPKCQTEWLTAQKHCEDCASTLVPRLIYDGEIGAVKRGWRGAK